ncbi:hypothetical protein [Bradyrhizobium yuanmingense]|uniref:hypothetical protein n=1 Tax=Bradyrhizobium yuanmingense TaxID=108015 RepID=UPI0009422D9B|nr:hypothetical protein [Bradyrhizobium yuanmingense]
MQKLMRETIRIIRDSGGSGIFVAQGSRHTRIHFTGRDGRRRVVLIPKGLPTRALPQESAQSSAA